MNVSRMLKVGNETVVAGGGEISDLQELQTTLEDLQGYDFRMDDGIELDSREYHQYLTRIFYNQRNRMNPYWNNICIAGFCKESPAASKKTAYLGFVDMLGTNFTDNYMATGMGGHMALPILRNNYRPDLTRAEATWRFRSSEIITVPT